MKKKKKRGFFWLLSMVAGFVCALVLGALFYGTMVYQLAGEERAAENAQIQGTMLALPAALEAENMQEIDVGGVRCRVVTRTYALEDGKKAQAISASPAAYFERLAIEGYTPKLMTGFTLAGLTAVCYNKEDVCLLAARNGENIFFLAAQADEQTLYTLGAGARLEAETR